VEMDHVEPALTHGPKSSQRGRRPECDRSDGSVGPDPQGAAQPDHVLMTGRRVQRGQNCRFVAELAELACKAEHLALYPSGNAQAIGTVQRDAQDETDPSGSGSRDQLVARPVRLE
jgi:hypothetical protein